jgi:hypothetical protein
MYASDSTRSPGRKLSFAILIGMVLAIPLFFVWLLVYDRQSQSSEASRSITEGWGDAQSISGPVLVIPYRSMTEEAVGDGLKRVVTRREVWKELTLQPEVARIASTITPEIRKRRIYEAVVYTADAKGQARFALPADLARYGVAARHLKAFRSAVGREAGLLEQILAPSLRSSNADRREAGLQELEQLAELTSQLAHLLLVRDLRDLAR